MQRSIWLGAAFSLGLCTACFAQIKGKVTLLGNLPDIKPITGMSAIPQCAQMHKDPVYEDTVVAGDKGELANVIVFIKESKPGELKGPQISTPATLNQNGCMYTPHVLAVQTGQPIIVHNSDAFLHNVHGAPAVNKPFNFIQLNVDTKTLDALTAEETFQIKCDVHPWMKAVVRVFDHPYFAVSNEDGKFTIDTKGLKDGTYTVQAWHELYQDSNPQNVEIKGGKAVADVQFTFNTEAKPQASR